MCHVDYANYLHDKKNIDKATLYYRKAITLNPNNHYAYGGLAAAQVDKGLLEQALESCKKAISIKESAVLFILENLIYRSLGQPLLAEVARQKAIEFLGGNLAAYTHLSNLYLKFNMYEEAEYYCKEALKINPNDDDLRFHLNKIYSAKEKRKQGSS